MPMTWNGPAIVARIEARKGEATLEIAKRVLAAANAIVPVDTGELRDSGHVLPGPNGEAYVIYDAGHAHYVHDGTPRMEARPWLARACLMETGDALRTFTMVVNGASG